MADTFHNLPTQIIQFIREYASDRVQPHPTAKLIKNLIFNRDKEGKLYIYPFVVTLDTLDFIMDPDQYIEAQDHGHTR